MAKQKELNAEMTNLVDVEIRKLKASLLRSFADAIDPEFEQATSRAAEAAVPYGRKRKEKKSRARSTPGGAGVVN